jgi:hypothetical protein
MACRTTTHTLVDKLLGYCARGTVLALNFGAVRVDLGQPGFVLVTLEAALSHCPRPSYFGAEAVTLAISRP